MNRLGGVQGAQFKSGGREGCIPGSRVGLLSDLLEWATNKDSSSVFWLNGMAGTGKSRVIHTIRALLKLRCQAVHSQLCAPTSSTASLIGGSTYHYLLSLGCTEKDNVKITNVEKARSHLGSCDLVILDKQSMNSCKGMY